jgi:sodium/proline symporter
MSTADSQLLAAASAVSQNIVSEFFKVNLGKKASMWIARITVIIISVIAVFLALNPDSSVFRIVSFAWGGFGACFGPAVLLGLFWKRSNKWGILAGMISGGAMIFIWKFVVRVAFAGSVLDIYELLPAFILNLVVAVVVSLITKAPAKELVDTFEQVKAEE